MAVIGTLVVHVGAIKAATTSVQVALAAGCAPQSGKILRYPAKSLNHNYLENILAGSEGRQHPQIRRLRGMMTAGGPADIAVLSGERLSVLRPAQLKTAIETCFGDLIGDYTILHYIRPHADRALSGYAERVKIGTCDIPLREYLTDLTERGHFQQTPKLRSWQKVFGARYRLRPMLPAAMVRGDAVADFFNTVLGELPPDWVAPVPVNESLSATGLAQVARFQQQLQAETAAVRHVMGYEFAAAYCQETADVPAVSVGMEADIAEFFVARHLADAEQLDREFFGDEGLFVAALHARAARARQGDPEPLARPADQIGTEIAAGLIETLNAARNRNAMVRRLRTARYRAYVAGARQS